MTSNYHKTVCCSVSKLGNNRFFKISSSSSSEVFIGAASSSCILKLMQCSPKTEKRFQLTKIPELKSEQFKLPYKISNITFSHKQIKNLTED